MDLAALRSLLDKSGTAPTEYFSECPNLWSRIWSQPFAKAKQLKLVKTKAPKQALLPP